MWINQNFLIPNEIQAENGSIDISFLSLRTGLPLVIKMTQQGEVCVIIACSSMGGRAVIN